MSFAWIKPFVAAAISFGFFGVASAQSDCGMVANGGGSGNNAEALRVTMQNTAGKPTAITVGSQTYSYVRNGAGEIVSLRSTTGATVSLAELENEAAMREAATGNPKNAKNQPGTIDILVCDNGGGSGPFVMESLPREVIIGQSNAGSRDWWIDTVQNNIYAPSDLPVVIEPAAPQESAADRQARCTANTNQCISNADNISSGLYGFCAAGAQEIANKRGKNWGVVIIAAAAAFCVQGIESSRAKAKNQCYIKHVDCINGN